MKLKFMNIHKIYLNEASVRLEIVNQAQALQTLAGSNSELVLKLIEYYGAEFRKIINEFKIKLKRIPTADDLIWIAGVHTGKDPRIVAQELQKKLK